MASKNGMTVRDIMSKGPVTLKPDDILYLADEIMSLGRIRHLPVVEGDRLVGILSQRDLFHSALTAAIGVKPKEKKETLKSIRIRDIMKKPVISVPPGTGVKEAARLMIEKKIGCLPVVVDNSLVGLVTETDILRYVVVE
jgi:CBS domain-containing protein